jgi:hypothetical protein
MSADLSEFVSRLQKQGTTLCLPLGSSLGAALERYGLRADQEVLVRFGPERLEILARNEPAEVWDRLQLVLPHLHSLAKLIQDVSGRLAVSDPDLDRPETQADQLRGLLECLLADDLEPAIRKLESVRELAEGPAGGARR